MEIQKIPDFSLPEKEGRILKAAINVIIEKGYSASTTSEIARRAGLAEGTVFRYFKTKKDILKCILTQAINSINEKDTLKSMSVFIKDPGEKDPCIVFREVIYRGLRFFDEFYPVARILLIEALFHEDIREAIYHDIVVKVIEFQQLLHSKLIERGQIRDNVTWFGLANCLLGNMAAWVINRNFSGDTNEEMDLEYEADNITDIILYGITLEHDRGASRKHS
jgi:AcrR family transcriptional regulator